MAPFLIDWLAAPIRHFDTIDSTNNYAMTLANADTARPGTTIVAGTQTAGKGQRGRHWAEGAGSSLLMSVLVQPQCGLDKQFLFLAAIATGIVGEIGKVLPNSDVRVKWPNDIYIGDKKAGGILIENIIRGGKWAWSVVGLGLNVTQQAFPEELPGATSLALAGADGYTPEDLIQPIRRAILAATLNQSTMAATLGQYNSMLYKRGEMQRFSEGGEVWEGRVMIANADGSLAVLATEGYMRTLQHGQAEWLQA